MSSLNKLAHSINGNRKNGYHVAVWNCRRGLIDKDGNPTSKFTNIKSYLQKHNLETRLAYIPLFMEASTDFPPA